MKHHMQTTSLEAYYTHPSLGDHEQTVLVAIHAYPDSTDREIARHLGKEDPNWVRPRRFSLVEKGLVVKGKKRRCMVTGKNAITWRVK